MDTTGVYFARHSGRQSSGEQSTALRLATDLHPADNKAAFGGSDSVLLHARRQQRQTNQHPAAGSRSRIPGERSLEQDLLDRAAKYPARYLWYSDQGFDELLSPEYQRLSQVAHYSRAVSACTV